MPCSCFGKKDKKGGVLGGGEEEKYRPRDSHEREPLAPVPIPVSQTKKAQPLLEGAAPPPTAATAVTAAAPGTPPSSQAAPNNATTGGGDAARLRPEDDPDKANRRRDVVASFYSDQCELIGFKTTGSRPPSAHVGPDGPAATSSPATSSPSSTRSGSAAICRADLAEKRREFFKDLTLEDDDSSPRGGSRPTSRLTDPGSQPTPRQSQFQESLERLHHTLPHLKKTPSPRSKNFSTSTPLVHQQQSLERNSVTSPSEDEREPLLPHSSPEQAPKIVPKKPDHTEIPKQPSLDVGFDLDLHDDVSEEAPLLSVKETHPNSNIIIESSVSTTVQKVSSEILPDKSDNIERKLNLATPESKAPDLLVDFTTTEVKSPEYSVNFPTEPTENSKPLVDVQTQPMDSAGPLIDSQSLEGKDLFNDPESDKLFNHVLQQNSVIVESSSIQSDSQVPPNVTDLLTTNQSPFVEVKADEPFTRSEEINVNISAPEIIAGKVDPFALDSRGFDESPKVISSSPKVDPFVQIDTPFLVEEFSAGNPTPIENQFNVDFSNDLQTRPVIIEETLKEHPKEHPKEEQQQMFDFNPQNTHMTFENAIEQTPQTQTIVETTRQFISGSPDEQKTSQTIVETTRQFITAPPEEQTSQTIIETTHHTISAGDHPEDLEEGEAPQTIVETTRHFITGVPEGEESNKFLELAQQFSSGSPDEETIVKTTTQQFVSGSPDNAFTETIVKTTQQIVSGDLDGGDDGQRTMTTTVEKTSSFSPPTTDAFFLSSVEEPDEVQSEKVLIQNGIMTTTTTVTSNGNTTTTVTETEVPEHLTKSILSEEVKEEPKLPDVPCFGVPPPPSSPPPPLPEGQLVDDTLTSPSAVVIPPCGGEEILPPAPPTPPAEHHGETSTPVEGHQQFEFEPSAPVYPSEDKEDLPPAPPTPPTPRVDDLMPSKAPPLQPPPTENEASLPPTPPTPLREDEEIAPPAAPVTPRKESKKKRKKNKNKANANANAPASPSSPNAPTSPSNTTNTTTTTTCGVSEIVVSSNLEDDGLGSEIDDALETLECLSEEGKKERAAASS